MYFAQKNKEEKITGMLPFWDWGEVLLSLSSQIEAGQKPE